MKNKFYLALLLTFVIGISFTSAFSVSAPYMENKELLLYPDSGETDLQFVLQNGGGATDDVIVRATILSGSEIIRIADENQTYLVSPGDKVPINFKVTVPEGSQINNTFPVVISFATVTVSGSGEFGFGTGQEQRFTVKLIGRPVTEEEMNLQEIALYIFLGILALIAIMLIIYARKRVKKR